MANAKPPLRVLHLASFSGNIGDNANHIGTRASFARLLPYEIDYTPLEIREFFWGQRQWDSTLIQYINHFDLLQIGGGNYFELWVEKSRTGCSIDLPPELLEKINIPVLFYGLGVDAGQGVPPICRQRFSRFFDAITARESCFVALRNDGAISTLKRFFPDLLTERVIQVPDGGFFYSAIDSDNGSNRCLRSSRPAIAINLAGDMLDTRFPLSNGEKSKYLSYDEFNRGFAEVIAAVLEGDPKKNIVFVPHIWRDLEAIHCLLEKIPDSLRRTRIEVAPYKTGELACRELLSYYQQADLCLAMRFHANVCPIAMGVPTIGLINYPQIKYLYDALSLGGQCITVNRPDFGEPLRDLIYTALGKPDLLRQRQLSATDQLEADIQVGIEKIATWLQAVIS